MAMDGRRLLARPFNGLGATNASLLSFDQGTLAQIKQALSGQPVSGNPFPNATPQQLALALAGSTPWKPWNQSGTIDKAIANTVAKFSSIGGSDQILRSLQIAAGMISGTPQVTVGMSTPGVKVTQDAATTASMKSGIAALLGVGVPTSGSPLPTSGPPSVTVTGPTGTAAVPLSAVTPTPGAPATSGAVLAPAPNCSAMGMSTSADGLSCIARSGSAPGGSGASVPLSTVLGLANPGDPSSVVAPAGPTGLGTPLAGAPPAPSGPFDFLFAPITLPLVNVAVPTWGVGLGLGALGYAWWRRSKRSRASTPAAPIGGPV